MALAPKTKLWIGLGVFTMVVFGLLSLNGDTFSGNLTLMPLITPKQCEDLKKACTEAKDPNAAACYNFEKVDCARILANPQANKTPIPISEIKATTAPRPRVKTPAKPTTPTTPAKVRGAAPSPSDKGTTTRSTGSIGTSAADLQKVFDAYPESPSQGTLDTNKMR